MQLTTVKIEKPDDINFILGQSHFIKSVEDIHESMVQTVPGIKFGLAFCEASGEMLVRWTGTDDSMIELAKRNALALSAGHSFILFLGPGFFPVNVLNPIKMVPEVCRIFCATANPVEVVIAETSRAAAFWVSSTAARAKASKTPKALPGAKTCCARSVTSSNYKST